MASSVSTGSLVPPGANSLMPLSSKGLCEAETTAAGTPRASGQEGERRASAGRRRRRRRRPRWPGRPRTRPGGADRTGGCRARRGRPAPRGPWPRPGRAPSASSAVSSTLATPRTPSVPKRARATALPLGVLRRLAGLLQAVLLGLLLAGVAREEAGALQRGRSSGSSRTGCGRCPSRSALAWPETPPPSMVASMS